MSITNKIVDNDNIVKVAFASMIGSTIKWYDFIIYSQATALVFGRVFFPASDTTVSTLAGFATFAVGFAARPSERSSSVTTETASGVKLHS